MGVGRVEGCYPVPINLHNGLLVVLSLVTDESPFAAKCANSIFIYYFTLLHGQSVHPPTDIPAHA